MAQLSLLIDIFNSLLSLSLSLALASTIGIVLEIRIFYLSGKSGVGIKR